MKIFPKTIVAIEMQDHRAQLIELKESYKGVELTAYNSITIPDNLIQNGEIKDAARLEEVIKNFFATANPKLGKIRRAAVILPARVTFSHIFRFPASFSPKEVHKAIPYQAETIIPFNVNQIFWDETILKKGEKEQTVLFAAISKETAESYTRIFENIGVTPFLFGVSVDALRNALKDQISPTENSVIIDLEPIATNYLVLEGEQMVTYFSSNEGMDVPYQEWSKKLNLQSKNYHENWQQILKNPEGQKAAAVFVEKHLHQAQAIINEQQKKGAVKKIDTIYMVGGFTTLEGSVAQAKKYFSKQQVKVGEPKKNILVDEKRFKKRTQDTNEGPLYSVGFTNVIGMGKEALSFSNKTSINLLPDSLKKRFSRARYSFFVQFALVFITFFGLISAAYTLYIHQLLSYERFGVELQKNSIDNKLFGTRYQQVKEDLTQFNSEVSVLSSLDTALFSVGDTFKRVYDLRPAGITFTGLQFNDEDISMKVSGIADTRENLVKLQQVYQAESFIKSVALPISNYDKKTAISFTITFLFNFPELPPYGTHVTQ